MCIIYFNHLLIGQKAFQVIGKSHIQHFREFHRWGFEPRIAYQALPRQKQGVFTDVYETKIVGAIFAGGRLLLYWFFLFNPQSKTKFLRDEL